MSRKWNSVFRDIEHLYKQSARLLEDVGEVLRSQAQSPHQGVGGKSGMSLERPSDWMLGWVCRFFGPVDTADGRTRIGYVAVIMYARSTDDYAELDEPVVAWGIWDYDAGANFKYWYWMSKAWAWSEERPIDGHSPVSSRLDSHGVFATGTSWALPLSSIGGPADLERLVAAPLRQVLWPA